MTSPLLSLYLASSPSRDAGAVGRGTPARGNGSPDPERATLAEWDAALVAQVRAGEPAALEAIFRKEGDRLLRFATQQLHSLDAAEDVVQDVFLGVWRLRERWAVHTSIASYLFQAVRHRVASRLQQRPGEDPRFAAPLLSDELPGFAADGPDQELEDAELRRAIRVAVAALSPRTREVFQLSRDHGLTYREIAALLGVSVKTVEMHVGRALAALRLALAAWVA